MLVLLLVRSRLIGMLVLLLVRSPLARQRLSASLRQRRSRVSIQLSAISYQLMG
ncbi:MAG: hypothetical protein F6K55_13305 [Moorea sp. SIO4A3]|nr:hypothetical protein [Moorena sp. SIO4A3]